MKPTNPIPIRYVIYDKRLDMDPSAYDYDDLHEPQNLLNLITDGQDLTIVPLELGSSSKFKELSKKETVFQMLSSGMAEGIICIDLSRLSKQMSDIDRALRLIKEKQLLSIRTLLKEYRPSDIKQLDYDWLLGP